MKPHVATETNPGPQFLVWVQRSFGTLCSWVALLLRIQWKGNLSAWCNLCPQHGSHVIELQLRRCRRSHKVSLWLTETAAAGQCVCVLVGSHLWKYHYAIVNGKVFMFQPFLTDPESWGKFYWRLLGCAARWERLLLGYSVSPLVSLHNWQRHQRGPPDGPNREPSPTLLHFLPSLWHTVPPSAATSAVSAPAQWKNTICFHRSW